MTAITPTMLYYIQAMEKPLREHYGPVVIKTVASETFQRQLGYAASAMLTSPAAVVLSLSFPFVAEKVSQVVGYVVLGVGSDPQSELMAFIKLTKDFCGNQAELISFLFSVCKGTPNPEFLYSQGQIMFKAVVLDTACQYVSGKTSSYVGKSAYALLAPCVVPNASYFTLPLGRSLVWIASSLGQSLARSPAKASVKDGIDLDDFKITKQKIEDDFVLV